MSILLGVGGGFGGGGGVGGTEGILVGDFVGHVGGSGGFVLVDACFGEEGLLSVGVTVGARTGLIWERKLEESYIWDSC